MGDFLCDIAPVLKEEFTYEGRKQITLREKIVAWRNGFTSKTYVMFRLNKNNPKKFISNWDQKRMVCNINQCKWTTDDTIFYKLHDNDLCVPDLYGSIISGVFVDQRGEEFSPIVWIEEYLKSEDALVIKPMGGQQGGGVRIVEILSNCYCINGEYISKNDLSDFLESLDNVLVCEYASQHPYTNEIYPDSVNTIRILTIVPPQSREAYIAAAVHRFGTDESKPVDNWSQGGLCAEIDIETGTLGRAAAVKGSEVQFIETHPDTGVQISGTSIPNWNDLSDKIISIASEYPQSPYIGWDVVVTNNGFKIIEGNSTPGMNMPQIFEGLLSDRKNAEFFQEFM